jgi:hypothetical protein
MSELYEALAAFQHVVNSYAEDSALVEVKLKSKCFDKIRWVVIRELETDGAMNIGGAFGFEDLKSEKLYFRCRGIKFTKDEK